MSDVFAQILSWLPVKSLLRFRSVSKTFRALIDSDYMIKLHMKRSVQTNSNLNVIFGNDICLRYLNLDSSVVNEIDNPLYFAIFQSLIVGSCNGIVCMCTPEPENEIAFWNPFVGKVKKTQLAPAPYSEGIGCGFCVKSFGYDHLQDEYKVVRLVQCCSLDNDLIHSTMAVFSLKTDGWREIGGFPYHICYRRNSNVFTAGALHWLVSEKPNPKIEFLIAAFDLTTEDLRLVPEPEFVNENVKVNLGILGECLTVVCNYPEKNVDIWVMKSYGVRDSWSKLISTTDAKLITGLDILRPVLCSKNGEEVLLEKNFEKLYWYNLAKKTVKRFKVSGMPDFFVSEVFTGSLAQLNTFTASGSGKKEEKIENKKKKKRDDFLSKGFKLVL